jgi:hypothetical protein
MSAGACNEQTDDECKFESNEEDGEDGEVEDW